ncbi:MULTISPECIES: CGNR zinc finger domain-containing protein [Streptomyces]|uniref:CGNR zinc finger domain-containing protein n=1 Tax=Streptomyces TaxID=1883 RepID=UPI00225A9B27|nr:MULTISPECIES: CGNR zinc finger domain-containing protein [Streptomyces]MCX5447430.1 CGNR zinc finger domain-containing protein [Streptomyces libani]WDT58197.1 CGNR zinc finger domain-containing protein [Streptomyces sp. G7(2002)]
MQQNPYGEDPVRLIVDLAAVPPRSPEEFADRCVKAGMAIDRPVGEADLAELLAFIPRWLAVVDAETPRQRAAELNELLTMSSSHPRLTDHADGGWHIHYRDDDLGLASVVRAVVSVGTALHLTGRGMDRLSRCALAECGRAYGDFTRAGRQRYCSHACANRDAVRRFRARRAERSG